MTELTLQEYSQEIEGMLERTSYDEAVAHCRHILQQYPKYVEAYRLLGKAALDREDDEHATDLFARVLSADPSDFVSRAGLAIVNDRKDSLPDAVWHMERAYELAPGNPVVQDELRKLYGRRDGVEPQRIPLTRGALARLYMNGELYSEAVAELRAMLAVEPDRADLQVLLAQALWSDEQKLEASDVALRVLDKMPYCLDANLILGEIWMSGGREEDAEVPLKRALALDPEGVRAAMLFGKSSPIPAKPAQMTALEYTAPVQEAVVEEAPEWLAGLGTAAEITAGGAEEVPAWLQGIGPAAPEALVAEAPVAEAAPPEVAAPPAVIETVEEAPAWLSGLGEAKAPSTPVQAAPTAEAEEMPDWLSQLRAEVAPLPAAEAAPEEAEIPDWLQAIRPPTAEQPTQAVEEAEEGMPDWLAQLRQVAPVPTAEAEAAPPEELAVPEEAEIPDWLQALKPEAAEQLAPALEEAESPDWLAQLREAAQAPEMQVAAEEPLAAPEPAEIPDWLQALKPQEVEAAAPTEEISEWLSTLPAEPEAVGPVEAAPVAAEEQPAWLTGEGAMPSPEEAMAYFAKLSAGKEVELQAQAEAEAEERMASIMGRKPEAKPEVEPEVVTPPVPVVAKMPEVPPVEAPQPPVEEQPAWLTGEGAMPSPEEAMAYFAKLSAGKEAELQAQAEAEAEERMASIMGRKPEAKLEVKPQVVTPPAPVEISEPQVEALPAEEAPAMPEWPTEPEVELVPEQIVEAAPILEAPTGWAAWAEAKAAEETMPVIEQEAIEGLAAGWPAPEVAPPVAVEEAPVAEALIEAAPAARVPVLEAVGPDWWYQTLTDEEGPAEETLGEEGIPVVEAISFAAPASVQGYVPVPAAPVVTPPVRVEPPPPPPPPAAKPAPRAPKRLVRAKPTSATPPKPVVDMESIIARLRANPDDYGALLDMARGHTQLGDLSAAHGAYEELIRRNAVMDDVISDLEKAVGDNPDHVDLTRLLGDAHMKAGNLQRALKLYRQALKRL